MKINSVSHISLDKKEFYKSWLVVLKPFHRLTDKQIDVAAGFLNHRAMLAEEIDNPALLDRLLLSTETCKAIREELNMTCPHFRVVMTKLRRSGFIKNNTINMKYIPEVDFSQKNFSLLFNFEFKDVDAKQVSK